MPRQARVDIAGFHYVTNRSGGETKIFKTDEEKAEFLSIVCKSCERYGAKIHAFFISETSYHLIVETDRPNLSLLMRQISAAYSIYHNKKHRKKGTIWHDRFSSWVINGNKEHELIHKYIALMVKTGKYPKEYQFSYINTIFSEDETIGCFEKSIKKKKLTGFLKGKFEDSDEEALRLFKREANLGKKSETVAGKKEPLEKIFKKIKSKEKRDKKIKKAFSAGFSQNEIARFLNLSQSSVSKIVNAVERE